MPFRSTYIYLYINIFCIKNRVYNLLTFKNGLNSTGRFGNSPKYLGFSPLWHLIHTALIICIYQTQTCQDFQQCTFPIIANDNEVITHNVDKYFTLTVKQLLAKSVAKFD